MAFAGKLGTSSSRLGNIRLAAVDAVFSELLVCNAFVPHRIVSLYWVHGSYNTDLLDSLFESSYPPCDTVRGRPDEQATHRTRMGADDSLRTRPGSDDDLRRRPPTCGNES